MQQETAAAPPSNSHLVPIPVGHPSQVSQLLVRMEGLNANAHGEENPEQINKPADCKSRLSRLDFNPCCCCCCCWGCCNLKFICTMQAIVWLFLGVACILFAPFVSPSEFQYLLAILAIFWIPSGTTLLVGANRHISSRKNSAILCWVSCGLNVLSFPIAVWMQYLYRTNSQFSIPVGLGTINKDPETIVPFIVIHDYWYIYFCLCAFAMGFKVWNGRENEPAHGCTKMDDSPPFYGNYGDTPIPAINPVQIQQELLQLWMLRLNAHGERENPERINEPAGHKSRLRRLDFNPCCFCCFSWNLKVNCTILAILTILNGAKPAVYAIGAPLDIRPFAYALTILSIFQGATLVIGANKCISSRKISAILCWVSSGLSLLSFPLVEWFDWYTTQTSTGASVQQFLKKYNTEITTTGILLNGILQIYYFLCAFAMGLKVMKGKENEPAHGCRKMDDQPPFYGNYGDIPLSQVQMQQLLQQLQQDRMQRDQLQAQQRLQQQQSSHQAELR